MRAINTIEFDDVELLDEAAELFQDDVHAQELLNAYIRGNLSETDLTHRLKFLKDKALQRAPESLVRKAEFAREEDFYEEHA